MHCLCGTHKSFGRTAVQLCNHVAKRSDAGRAGCGLICSRRSWCCACRGLETRSHSSAEQDSSTSWLNTAQVDVVAQVVAILLKDPTLAGSPSIGVITPYRAQVRHSCSLRPCILHLRVLRMLCGGCGAAQSVYCIYSLVQSRCHWQSDALSCGASLIIDRCRCMPSRPPWAVMRSPLAAIAAERSSRVQMSDLQLMR